MTGLKRQNTFVSIRDKMYVTFVDMGRSNVTSKSAKILIAILFQVSDKNIYKAKK